MDRIGLKLLERELQEDCRVAADVVHQARGRMKAGAPHGPEAAAFHLARLFNVIEGIALRVARLFENHIDPDAGWHAELIRRLSLDIPGVRPAFWRDPLLIADLRELRGFRHVVRHAYDLTVDPDRMTDLVDRADRVVAQLPTLCDEFIREVSESLDQG